MNSGLIPLSFSSVVFLTKSREPTWTPCFINIRHFRTKRCPNPLTHRQSLTDNRIDPSNRLRPEARYVLPSNKTTLDQCNQSWFANTAYTIRKKMLKRLTSHRSHSYTLQPNRLPDGVQNDIQLDDGITPHLHTRLFAVECRIYSHPNVQYGIPAKCLFSICLVSKNEPRTNVCN